MVLVQRGRAGRAMHQRRTWQTQRATTADAIAAARARPSQTGLFALLVGPTQKGCNELKDLELLGVGTIEGQEVEEVVCHDLSVFKRKNAHMSAEVRLRWEGGV